MFIKKLKKNKGATLIEIVITTVIFTIIMAAVSMFMRDIYFYNNIFTGGMNSYDEVKKVLHPIASEIRSASSSSLGAYPIEVAENNNFIFFSDLNNNGLKERVRYYLSGTKMMRGVIVPSGNPLSYSSDDEAITEIAQSVANSSTPIFTYFDTNYNGDTSPLGDPVSIPNIRLVKINLAI